MKTTNGIEMRIVGVNNAIRKIWVQNKVKYNKWEQVIMGEEEFKKMLKKEFRPYYEEFKKAGEKDLLDYFYRYGEEYGKDTYIFRRMEEE